MSKKIPQDPLQILLSQIKTKDPKMLLLLEQQIRAGVAAGDQKEAVRRLRIQNKKLLEQVARYKDELAELKEDKDRIALKEKQLRKWNVVLSDALGSCSSCWGEDANCPLCNGNGQPGWRSINKRLFNSYVLPCLEKMYLPGRN
jgi:hypothetical protein